uniref:PDZ domain-containing protein n=2 Tax=Panagrolaimus superbus TaxID=310955 RepID=A0A914Z5J8_9BILA
MDSEATTEPLEQAFTKIYYYIDKETDPYLTTVDVPLSCVTLKDFKEKLPKTTYKYYNQIMFEGSVVKSEVKSDQEFLKPCQNNKIIMILLTDEQATPIAPLQQHLVPLRKQSQALQQSSYRASRFSKPIGNNGLRRRGSDTKIRKNSYGEDTYYRDSNDYTRFSDGDSSMFTEFTSVSQQRKRKIYRHTRKHTSNNNYHHRRISPSFVSTSFSDASMAIDVIEVTFDLTQKKPLGLKILTKEEERGFCIFVAEVSPNSLASQDKRIKANMIILEVNDIRLGDYDKEQAVDYLKQACSGRERFVRFTFAQTERERFTPHDETVYPIDTSTWVKQTMVHNNLLPAINEDYRSSPNPLKLVYNPCCLNAGGFPSSGVGTSLCSGDSSSHINANMTQMYQLQPKRFHVNQKLDIAVAMVLPGGLELKHKKNGKKTFASTEMVDWLRSNVKGLEESEKCQKFATKLVEDGYISLVIDTNQFVVKTEGFYYFTDKLKKLAFKHRPLAPLNQKPAMDETIYAQQKGWREKFRRFFCAAPQRQQQQNLRQPQHPSAVRQLYDENSPPNLLNLPLPAYRSSLYSHTKMHQNSQAKTQQTYIP